MARIAFDISSLNHPFNSGIQRYANNLLQGLTHLKENHTYVLLGGIEPEQWPRKVETPAPYLPPATGGWLNPMLALLARTHQADLLFRPWGTLPERRTCPGVVTIHDTIPLAYPEWVVNSNIVDLFKKDFPRCLPHTDGIIAISEQTKKDIIHYYGVDEARIHVILHGVDPAFFTAQPLAIPSTINGQKITAPYILSTGVFEPRKNRERLIVAYNQIREKYKHENWQLVLTGPSGWHFETLHEAIRQSPFKEDIILTGEVDDPTLRSLYAGAHIFIYPSLYEGFGLPVLEAMAAGAPTITSNCSSLPEVGGEAVLYCEPLEVDSIASVLETLLSNESLRNSLSHKGRERAKLFTWAKTARESLAVFEHYLS